jgi:pyruvate formate lyase activating enzyme
MNGIVFDIKRYAIHDGPGIRTTIFLKGCPLRCHWCHNPESFSQQIQSFDLSYSLGDQQVISKKEIGKSYSVLELLKEIQRDQVFHEESKGGVTFSGGEPLLQVDFLEQVLTLCKSREIHTVVDTSGYASLDDLKRIIPHTDLFLFDLKQMNDAKHQEYTRVSNQMILDNLDHLLKERAKVRIRIPLIPDYNDSKENMEAIIAFLSQYQWKPEINLLPYHRMGKEKYDRFDIAYKMKDIASAKKDDYQWIVNAFEVEGFIINYE